MADMTEEEELQLYAEEAAWKRFKEEVTVLRIYKFPLAQLLEHIKQQYKRHKR